MGADHTKSLCLLIIFLTAAVLPTRVWSADKTFTVNDTALTSDADLTDSECDTDTATSGDQCTLKAAVEQANYDATRSYEIILGANTYCVDGVLSIDSNMTVTGDSSGDTIIDAGNASSFSDATCKTTASSDRIFSVSTGLSFSLSDITLMGGTNASGGNAIYTENSVTLTINRATIKNNSTMAASGEISGGAIYIGKSSSATIADSTISNNNIGNYTTSSTDYARGGAIYLGVSSSLTLHDSTLSTNILGVDVGNAYGGNIFADEQTTLTLEGTTIYQGIVVSNEGTAAGGGVYVSGDSSLSMTDSTVSKNSVQCMSTTAGKQSYGAGLVVIADSTLVIDTSTLKSNTVIANSGNGMGGALYFYNGTGEITDSTISGNIVNVTSSHTSYGGGIYSNKATLSIDRSTLTENEANGVSTTATTTSAAGAGVYGNSGTISITNSTIHNNQATGMYNAYGGGVFSWAGTIHIVHSTISQNGATGGAHAYGGGIIEKPGTINIINSIVADNTVSGSTSIFGADCYGEIDTYGYNIIEEINTSGSTDCTLDTSTSGIDASLDITGSDPALGALTDNGGETSTQAIDSSSIAFGAGSCLDVTGNVVTLDQRGMARDSNCDIGAFDYGANESGLCSDDIDNDEDTYIDCDDSDCTTDTACTPVVATTEEGYCGDGIDNDSDGNIDCQDSDCTTDAACTPVVATTEEDNCGDGIDNDGDDDVDCDDLDCESDLACYVDIGVDGTDINLPTNSGEIVEDKDTGLNGYLAGGSFMNCNCSFTETRFSNGFGFIYFILSLSLTGLILLRKKVNASR